MNVEVQVDGASVAEDRARLACVYSRTFGVCLACPHGSHVNSRLGTPATVWHEIPEFGRYGLCAAHDEEWRKPR